MIKQAEPQPVSNTFLYLRGIPEDIKTAFKDLCVRQHISMTQKIIEMIQSELSKEHQK